MNTPIQGVHRQLPILDTQGMAIEEHRCIRQKTQQGQRLALQRPVHGAGSPAHRINGIAHHLRTQLRKTLAQAPVGHVMQPHPIPAPGLHHHWRQGIAHLRKSLLQSSQLIPLLRRGGQ